MNECPRVGPRECNFNPGTECDKPPHGTRAEQERLGSKPCEICDVAVAYWERRKMPDCTRPGPCFFKEGEKCSRDFGLPCPYEEVILV